MAATVQKAGQPSRPNLVVLLSDDHPAYVLGADGNEMAHTPNLDRLAAGGVRFARNYCQYPVCTPSRASMLTGQLPHAAGVTTLNTPLAEDKPTIAKQLRAAGYYTGVVGKMHWNCRPGPPQPGSHGFDSVMVDQGAWERYRDLVQDQIVEFHYFGGKMPLPDEIRTKPPYRDFLDPTRIWMNADCLPDPTYERDMRGTFLIEQGIDFIKEHRNEPFALWIGLSEPHAPFAFPVEDRDLYTADQFQLPPVGPDDGESVPLIFRELTDDDRKGITAACYTSVQYMDRNFGRVLRALEQLGLEDNTLVIYTSDHGALLGHHGRVEKHCLYDEAIRTPLLMRFPRAFSGGRVVNAMTETVDIAGTILELLDAPPLPVDQGRSLVPLIKGESTENRSEIFAEFLENEEAAIRTDEWKLIYCSGKRHRMDGLETDAPTPGRNLKLFDLINDPGELHNRIGDPATAAVAAHLLKRMLERFVVTHPEAQELPNGLSIEEKLDLFVRPRDARYMANGIRFMKYGVKPK